MSADALYYLDLCFDLKFAQLSERQLVELTGPAFRGALGARLRRMSCTAGLAECLPCPLSVHCPFPAFFAPGEPARRPGHLAGMGSVPRPFFLRAPGANEALDGELRLTLVGTAAAQLPLVAAAIKDMGWGCTDEQIRYEVTGLRALTPAGWIAVGAGGPSLRDPFVRFSDVARSLSGQRVDRAVISLITPLQLGADGELRSRADGQAFVQRLVERVESLSVLYCGGTADRKPWARDLAATVQVVDDKTQMWHGATRSRRHGESVSVSGLVGQFVLGGDLSPFAPYLWCLPAIGLGKKTTRGCGECDVQLY